MNSRLSGAYSDNRDKSLCPVYADTGFEVIADNIRHSHERHLRFHAALKKVFHIGSIKINLAIHKVVKGIVYR